MWEWSIRNIFLFNAKSMAVDSNVEPWTRPNDTLQKHILVRCNTWSWYKVGFSKEIVLKCFSYSTGEAFSFYMRKNVHLSEWDALLCRIIAVYEFYAFFSQVSRWIPSNDKMKKFHRIVSQTLNAWLPTNPSLHYRYAHERLYSCSSNSAQEAHWTIKCRVCSALRDEEVSCLPHQRRDHARTHLSIKASEDGELVESMTQRCFDSNLILPTPSHHALQMALANLAALCST